MPISLSPQERRVRDILIKTAKDNAHTRRAGLIGYKELWERISTRKWGRARKDAIVPMIVKISAHELNRGRPPLNELVVSVTSNEPGESWKSIQAHLKQRWSAIAEYNSHLSAQEACWRHWGRTGHSSQSDDDVEEGLLQDRTVTFRQRNAKIIATRKRLDDNTCQACRFRLQVNGRFVIDCHHRNPLGDREAPRITRIEELICLCPTCHRIAHTHRYPLDPKEIREARGAR
jgi:predicted HNH restriction endonuclease